MRIFSKFERPINIRLKPLNEKVLGWLNIEREREMAIYISFLNCHGPASSFSLPFSGYTRSQWSVPNGDFQFESTCVEYSLCNPFLAIRGVGDFFRDLNDLIDKADISDHMLLNLVLDDFEDVNSYAVDFFKHGSLHTITKMNFIRNSDVFAILKDWTLLLKVFNMCVENDGTLFAHAISYLATEFEDKFKMTGGSVKIF